MITVWKLAYTLAEPLGASPMGVNTLAHAIAAHRGISQPVDVTLELLTDPADIAVAREFGQWLAPHVERVTITRNATLDGDRAGMITVYGTDRWEVTALCDRLAENLNWVYAHTVFCGESDRDDGHMVMAKYKLP